MNVFIIQPPLVQLNAPYPSGAYLSAFFKKSGCRTFWSDFSVELANSVFSSAGIKRIFDLTENHALELASRFQASGDENAAGNLRRYVFQKNLWVEWTDSIMEILRDGISQSTREVCHRFIYSPFVPRGMRMENYIEGTEGELTVDDARNLATAALEDLADYVSVVFDRNFSLIRYAESIAVNENSFSDIEAALDSPLLDEFYVPLLEGLASRIEKTLESEKKCLVCITVPFAGTFTPALYTGRFLKNRFGRNVFVVMGGGFVNTELRDCSEKNFSRYADALSYDRGYGSYKVLLENFDSLDALFERGGIYKMRLFSGGQISAQCESDRQLEEYENRMTSEIIPDYSDVDFSRYARVADDKNPMQRIWSDGTWMKAYLAHGCYWHRCAFCDVTLDYVKSYRMTKIDELYDGLHSQCMEKKVRGIHFVDEAMPPSAMRKFAEKNIASESPLVWWGNVRFEKVYTRQLADLLSAGGLLGVSGGIEIATGTGLDKISKGTDINSIVSACCAFKEAGILVHAYMIYGYFGETEQDTINSMETLRQLFEAGLVDSCFWHKFVLTRHSRIYAEWKEGFHPDLEPVEDKSAGIFAKNGMHFKGENRLAKFGNGLNSALYSWMHGEKINVPVGRWFDFKTPMPSVPRDLVASCIEKYEERSRAENSSAIRNPLWLGGRIIRTGGKLYWLYMQEEFNAKLPKEVPEKAVSEFINIIEGLAPGKKNVGAFEEFMKVHGEFGKVLDRMKGRGIIC